ncbi:siphovirus Gp157 family protein [Secundilactobacillus kimchicus]|uniref:siphovirus Gp157 family protein n=1 Tax=Secundilactobacillus kimchicus TaxID=528209 RepID=UPI0024A81782|nr:siphovirus Gp157 family protein [Secundilactobacillus kimchicus]
MSLYKLGADYAQLSEKEDLDPEVLTDTLDAIHSDMGDKLDNIANWIDNNSSDIEGYKRKIKQLQDAKKKLERQNESLMAYITDSIDAAGIEIFKTEHHVLKPRNYKARVVIEDRGAIPIEFMRKVPASYEPDKAKLYQALRTNAYIPGVELKSIRKTVIK